MDTLSFEEGANASVLAYLKGIRSPGSHAQPLSAAPLVRPIPSDWGLQGPHPDIVERLWQLNADLPVDCRALVYGSPALVQPSTGVVFAVGTGTAYFLRLRTDLVADAVQAGCFLHCKWTFGGELDIQKEIGRDWVRGCFVAAEPAWCRASFEHFGKLT